MSLPPVRQIGTTIIQTGNAALRALRSRAASGWKATRRGTWRSVVAGGTMSAGRCFAVGRKPAMRGSR